MNVQELYERGYAMGTGTKVRNQIDGDTYILANVAEYMWCAINIRTGDRHHDVCPFNCSFQASRDSVIDALGQLTDWDVVSVGVK